MDSPKNATLTMCPVDVLETVPAAFADFLHPLGDSIPMTCSMDLSVVRDQIGPGTVKPSGPPANGISIAVEPNPFVIPKFRVVDGELDHAEVISIQAPAAVGKSVTARYISSATSSPLLDLANLAVGAGSLQGLLGGYSRDPAHAVRAFHRGDLPIIVDAIDEGVLYSGVRAFEAFLQTTVEFIASRRQVTNRAKIVLLGRDDSIDYSNLVFKIGEQDISICRVRLDFFDKDGALKLIPMYASVELDRLVGSGQIPANVGDKRRQGLTGQPMQELFEAYFKPIEFALGIPQGYLWDEEKGREFAGYAPLLSSIGALLAQVDNPMQVASRLKDAASPEAWDVIARVINEILEREQDKLKDKLAYSEALDNPYAPEEQLTYLIQIFLDQSLELVETLKFESAIHESDYREKVSSIRFDHPFIRDQEMANDVLGSKVFAHGVWHDLMSNDEGLERLKNLSRKPFLWRFLRNEMTSSECYIEGRYVGCILNSYWSDPLERKERAGVRVCDDGGVARVDIGDPAFDDTVSFYVEPPISLYERIRGFYINLPNVDVVIEGSVGDICHFQFQKTNSITCHGLTYRVKSAVLEGEFWLDAQYADVDAVNPVLAVLPESIYGWGKQLRELRPWRYLKDPRLLGPTNAILLVTLIQDCERSIRNRVIVLEDYGLPADDSSVDWARRGYGDLFSDFLEMLVKSRLVARRRQPTAGRQTHYTINFGDQFWANLLDAVRERLEGRDPPKDRRYRVFLNGCAADGRFGIP